MAETLNNLSVVMGLAAGICLAIAVFFWFFFHILQNGYFRSLYSDHTAKDTVTPKLATNIIPFIQ